MRKLLRCLLCFLYPINMIGMKINAMPCISESLEYIFTVDIVIFGNPFGHITEKQENTKSSKIKNSYLNTENWKLVWSEGHRHHPCQFCDYNGIARSLTLWGLCLHGKNVQSILYNFIFSSKFY